MGPIGIPEILIMVAGAAVLVLAVVRIGQWTGLTNAIAKAIRHNQKAA